MALRARGGRGHVLGLLVGARRVAHAERARDEDEDEVTHPGGHRVIGGAVDVEHEDRQDHRQRRDHQRARQIDHCRDRHTQVETGAVVSTADPRWHRV